MRGRVALITGAGGGIGRAVAVRLAEAGAVVVLVDRCDAALSDAREALRSVGAKELSLCADVREAAEVRAVINRVTADLGGPDVLVSCAGIEGAVAPLTEYPEDAFDRVMAVNAKGVFLGMKYALPGMLERGRGAVVNVASTSAIRGRANLAAYVASKHAVLGLTRVAALEVMDRGVRVNAVLPGPVETDLLRSLDAKAGLAGGVITRAAQARTAQPGDVAGPVLFLASDEARHLNGAALVIDGGGTAC